MQIQIIVASLLCLVATSHAFRQRQHSGRAKFSIKPLQENFFIDLPTLNDPSKITPALLNGEANYKNFVEKYDPNALLLGGEPYSVIKRVRELGLLSATVDSGLLQVLEEKGLTLTQLERALPIIDNAGLLPLLVKNKGLLLGLLPLLVEPAPALLPLVVSVVKTPASSYTSIGVLCVLAGVLEGVVDGNLILSSLAILLGLPAFALSAVLGKIGEPLPAVSTVATVFASSSSPSSGPSVSSNRPRAAARRPAAPDAAAPKAASSTKVTVKRSSAPSVAKASGGVQNGKRKTVRIN